MGNGPNKIDLQSLLSGRTDYKEDTEKVYESRPDLKPENMSTAGQEKADSINKSYGMKPGSREIDEPSNFRTDSPAQNFLADYYSTPSVDKPEMPEGGAYSGGQVADLPDYAKMNEKMQESVGEMGLSLGAAIEPKGENLTADAKARIKARAQGGSAKQRDRITKSYPDWPTW